MRRDIDIDWLTIFLWLTLAVLGWFNIYSTSMDSDPGIFNLSTFHGKQLFFIGVSILGGAAIIFLDKKFIEYISYGVYGVTIAALLAALVLAPEINGARSWFYFGGFGIQPAEFAKIGTLMALGKFMSRHNYSTKNLKDIAIAAGIIFLPMLIILLQNDAGSTIVFVALILMFYREGLHPLFLVAIFLSGLVGVISIILADQPWSAAVIISVMVILGGISFWLLKWKHLGLHLGVLAYFALIVVAVNVVPKDYHRARIQVLAASEEKIKENKSFQKVYYNLRESKVAIGSGGLTGKGYGNATHTKGDFVPEEHTDYIFCVIGEEHGFIGASLVMIIYFLFVVRLLYIAENSKSRFARIYGYGVTSFLFFHFVINVGMTIGLLPTIGIPFPFFSYGGSSMISFSMMTFILINQYSHRSNVLGGNTLRQ